MGWGDLGCTTAYPPSHPHWVCLSVSLIKQVLLIDFPLRPDGCGKKHLQNASVVDP